LNFAHVLVRLILNYFFFYQEMAIRNLDYIFTTAAPSIINASPEILVKLEKVLDEKSAEPWSHRRLPTLTATFPAIIDSDEGDDYTNQRGLVMARNSERNSSKIDRESRTDSFLLVATDADQAVSKQVRALRKKLQQIEMLEQKHSSGFQLDNQQIAKVASRAALVSELEELGFPYESELSQAFSGSVSAKESNKFEGSKKQRRKNKQKIAAQSDSSSVVSQEQNPVMGVEDSLALLIPEEKVSPFFVSFPQHSIYDLIFFNYPTI
jgi:inhibitor of Bruton tyrosine kinase